MPNMNNIRIKPHVPEGEDGFTLTSSDTSVSITISLLYSLPELSLATLLIASGFHASSNGVGFTAIQTSVIFSLVMIYPFQTSTHSIYTRIMKNK